MTEKKQDKKPKVLINLTDNEFHIEGVAITPKGSIELTKELRESKILKHAIEIGVLKING